MRQASQTCGLTDSPSLVAARLPTVVDHRIDPELRFSV